MTKELEEIRDDKLRIGLLGLKRLFETSKGKMSKDEIMAFDFTFLNITKVLLELQAIKEAKPSEALKALDRMIAVSDESKYWNCNDYVVDVNTIKQALLKAQEQEKALEIIKKKDVDIFELKYAFSIEEYNICKISKSKHLTQQEFDLLKEVLE